MADPALVHAWLAARSLARGLPAPVPDHGGWRVDTGSADERRRYVFAAPCEGLRALGAAIDEPRVLLKLCAPEAALRAILPPRWDVGRTGRMMRCDDGVPADAGLPLGFTADVIRDGARAEARILDADRATAASGYAAESGGVFVYDRIRTEEGYRRLGLGRALMGLLGATRRDPAAVPLLVATDMGRALYLTLGWRDVTDYSTALISG